MLEVDLPVPLKPKQLNHFCLDTPLSSRSTNEAIGRRCQAVKAIAGVHCARGRGIRAHEERLL